MKRLSVEDILLLHRLLIAETGGKDGLRDSGLLDMAETARTRPSAGRSSTPPCRQRLPSCAFR